MRLYFFKPLILLFILVAVFSCKNKEMKDLNQGEIHFNITYGGPPGTFGPAVLPKNLVVSFKKDKVLFDIRAIGNSGISNLSNPSENIYDTYLNLLGMKYYYEGDGEEIPPGLTSMQGMVITKTDETGEIIGLKCRRAEVTFPSLPDSVYEIWYTDEIEVEHPNSANPFKEIDGVLLNFFFFMGDREFIFEAESIYSKEIPDKVFERRTKYTPVSKDLMDSVITRLVK